MASKRAAAAAAVTNGATKGAAPGGANGYAAKLHEFSNDLDRLRLSIDGVLKDTDGQNDYEKLRQDLNKKTQEVEQKSREVNEIRKEGNDKVVKLQAKIAELERDQESLLRNFETRFRAWDEGEKRHSVDSKELSMLKDALASARKTAEIAEGEKRKLDRDLSNVNERVQELEKAESSLKNKCQMKDLELKDTNNTLNDCRDTLSKVQDDLGILPLDLERSVRKFDDLATKLHELIWHHFDREIPNPSLLIDVGDAMSQIPQVTSNSRAARYMRCALAEAIAADGLSRHIFKDFYLPEGKAGTELSSIIKSLEWLNEDHPLQATIIRCQLARACSHTSTVNDIPARAAGFVTNSLSPWVNDDGQRIRQFMSDLAALFSEAMRQWQKLQRGSKQARAVKALTIHLWLQAEDSRPGYDSKPVEGEPKSSPKASVAPCAVLFPQIRVGKDTDDGQDILFHGFALFPTQLAVVAAVQERGSIQISSRRATKIVAGVASDSEKASIRSLRGRADHPTASMSSTRSQKSVGGAGGGA
ncbi:hypothetical protein B0T17DRAFT_503637 [Bombardia bombarda]|uniref:Uncharacterized protein n=1 Tax=Bombardia bombarda TaxID=252184 RepID=A0AA39XLK5_9PEZI|nr:hypothetical protein B0T17DRAFT_503637 [Bombardia bombarda]